MTNTPAVRICITIPTYNNTHTIRPLIEQLRSCCLPCLIINDGSNAATQKILNDLQAQYTDWLQVFHRPQNKGKGGALKYGFKQAYEQGFTHALQLDADLQHQVSEIGNFIQSTHAHPDAFIVGQPIFDKSAPLARRLGRYLTHIFIWLETWSFQIKDALCGYRVYPLRPTMDILNNTMTGDRMDFDPEIAVRLFWHKVPIVNVPTHVLYYQDGVSHFDVYRDNLRLARMHTRLLWRLLWRTHR